VWRMVIVVCAAGVLGGCASRRGSAPALPAGSPLAKIQIGMEVRDLIGPPTDTHSSVTSEAYIPYSARGDAARVQWYYKGLAGSCSTPALAGVSARASPASSTTPTSRDTTARTDIDQE
jgi:hypothetical protein